MRMPQLKALTREHRLRGYSRLRKAVLIAFLQDDEYQAQRPPLPPPQMSTWEPNRPPLMSPSEVPPRGAIWEPEHEQEQPEGPLVPHWQDPALRSTELEAPLMNRQLKHRKNKDSKIAKKFISLDAEISNLKSQMEA